MNKNQKKFSKIYNKHVDSIYRFIYIKVSSRETAEDLTSEVFLRTWKVFSFENNEDIKNPRAFLYASARNLVIDYYRSQKKSQTISIDDNKTDIIDETQSLETQEIKKTEKEIVQKAITQLRPEYQDIVILKYIDNLPTKEIAEVLGKSKGAVRITLYRAMKNLKQVIDQLKV